MKRAAILLLSLVAIASLVSAATVPTVWVMYFNRASCQSMSSFFPVGTCRQNVTVVIPVADEKVIAYKVSVDYLDVSGAPKNKTQMVPRNDLDTVAFFYDVDDIQLKAVTVTQLSQFDAPVVVKP